jgi:hypothetical protein
MSRKDSVVDTFVECLTQLTRDKRKWSRSDIELYGTLISSLRNMPQRASGNAQLKKGARHWHVSGDFELLAPTLGSFVGHAATFPVFGGWF